MQNQHILQHFLHFFYLKNGIFIYGNAWTIQSNYKNKKYYGVKLRHIIIYNKKTNIGVKGAIVIPKKTEHSNTTLEIIAPIKLRKYLSLKNNSIVEIKL